MSNWDLLKRLRILYCILKMIVIRWGFEAGYHGNTCRCLETVLK